MLPNIISIEELTYQFNKKQVILDKLNIAVPPGSIYGFLGPNGAGKTTTLRLILGLLKMQEGSISIFGESIKKNRLSILKKTGSLIEQPSLYSHLTAVENLELYRLTYGLDKKRIDKVLQIVGLRDAANKKVKAYSLGMKQRLSIGIALLHNPELLILDEPTNGLDPGGIIETRELIIALNKNEGKTILVSSHILSEVEKMATHVAIIHKGKLLFQNSLEQLHHFKFKKAAVEIEVNDIEKANRILKKVTTIKMLHQDKLTIAFENKDKTAYINRLLMNEGINVSAIHVQHDDLEKMFVELTSAPLAS